MVKKILLVLAAVSFAVFVSCAGLIAWGLFEAYGGSPIEVTPEQQQNMLTVSDLEDYYQPIPGDRNLCESVVGYRYPAGSRELEYEFDMEYDSTVEDEVYLTTRFFWGIHTMAAREDYRGEVAGMQAGVLLSGSDLTLKTRRDLLTLGDDRYVALLFNNQDEPVGNYIVVRDDIRVYSVLVTGVYFDTREDLESFIGRFLERGDAL